jgi:CubicO group peptidase (beta-lactamase class C family)
MAVCLLLLVPFVPPGASGVAQEPPAYGLAPGHGIYADAVSEARRLILDAMEEYLIPGFSVAVAIDGEIVWAEGFGFADVENRVPVWPETKLRVASISKALTAGAVGRLVEDGLLDLDAPVQRYVPSFPDKGHTITTRLLGGHLGGITHYGDEDGMLGHVHYEDVVDGLEVFQDMDLIAVPGERYHYSSYGWNLISAVVQDAAGMPFLDYMQEVVFDPLGMTSTVAEHVDSIIYHRARHYEANRRDGTMLNAPYTDNSYKWAGGGFLSTASDLVTYGSAYLGDDFLRPETIELLWTSQRTTAGEVTNYGIGWRTRVMEGRRTVYHTGTAAGGKAILMILPEEGVVASFLSNSENRIPREETGFRIASLFVGIRE